MENLLFNCIFVVNSLLDIEIYGVKGARCLFAACSLTHESMLKWKQIDRQGQG